jgi:small subunit ribosomal protein S3
MGQKVNPIGFRLITRRDWRSKWYAEKEYAEWVVEDFKIRKYLRAKRPEASRFIIERTKGDVKVIIATSKPGLVYGKKGADIEVLQKDLSRFLKKDVSKVHLAVQEIKAAFLDAQTVADSIAKQLARRLPFRRVMKKAMQDTMSHREAKGIKIQISGRIGGAEIARTEWYKEGSIPLHTLKANIHYAQGRAETTYGSIGIKVWIHLSEPHVAQVKQVVGG